MNISPDFDAEAQLTPCRSTHKHAMRLFPPVWTQNIIRANAHNSGNYETRDNARRTDRASALSQLVLGFASATFRLLLDTASATPRPRLTYALASISSSIVARRAITLIVRLGT